MTLTQLEAFALTLAIEALAAFALGLSLKLPPLKCAIAAIAASTFTHPILWAVFADAQTVFDAWTTPVLEMAVMLAEAPFYRAIATAHWRRAVLLSLAVNAASWGAGELIYALV